MFKLLKGFIITALLASIFLSASIAKAADSKKPIVIPLHNWSSQVVMSYVIGGIFESMGNNVEYADSSCVWINSTRWCNYFSWSLVSGASFDAAKMLVDCLIGVIWLEL